MSLIAMLDGGRSIYYSDMFNSKFVVKSQSLLIQIHFISDPSPIIIALSALVTKGIGKKKTLFLGIFPKS